MFEPLRQRLERLLDDERGVSPVVGFVLIFALIILVFTIYQADVVPAQNAEVEFKHSQEVEGDMSQLNDAIQDTGASGVPQSATVATGVQYPDRALAINPGSPVGTLETVDAPDVEISGLSGGSGYWSSDPTFSTALVEYQSNYNNLQEETTYTLENGLVVKKFENGNTLLKSNGSVISNEGRQINLVLIGGDYRESSITSGPTVRPVSTSTEYLSLNATGSSPSIKIPTRIAQSDADYRTWDDIISENDQIDGIENYETNSNGPNAITLDLKDGQQYLIRLSKVTFSNPDSPTLKYLESEDGRMNRTAAVGTPETFTVTARDEFGNPIGGAAVDASTNGSGTFARSNGTSVNNVAANDDGRATFTYTPGAADTGNTSSINFALDNGSGDPALDNVSYSLTIPSDEDNENDGTAPAFSSGDFTNGYQLGVIVEGASTDTSTFNNVGSKNVTATDVRISGVFSGPGVSSTGTPENVSFAGKDVTLNGNLTSLDSNEYDIESGNTHDVSFDTNIDPPGAENGFMIVTIKYEYAQDGETETVAATYAVTIGQGSGGGGSGPGPP